MKMSSFKTYFCLLVLQVFLHFTLRHEVLGQRENQKNIFDQYYRYDEIYNYLQRLSQAYPHLLTLHVIGTTFEGRDILGVTISSGGNSTKNAIMMESGLHAREWIAPAVSLFVIYQLIQNYQSNSELLDMADWLIVPVSNPDGYEFTHTTDRYWRKNRKVVNESCIGVDGNRNFDFHWGEGRVGTHPCADSYRGESAFSEAESTALKNFALAANGRIKVFLSLHSFGQYIFYPWGYKVELPSDWESLHNLAQDAADAIRNYDGTIYEVGSLTRLSYVAPGVIVDYMKGVLNVSHSYFIELPGGAVYGFHPDPSRIFQISSQTFEGIKVFGGFAATAQ